MKALAWSLLLLLAASVPVVAGRIDVTDDTSAWVHHNAYLEVRFGVWNYGLHNTSPYPTQIGLQVIGQVDPWFSESVIPASSDKYYAGLLFEGWLESLDGTISVPLHDPNADRLGLPLGFLLVTPGWFQAGGSDPQQVAVMTGSVEMSEQTSAALFGANIGNYNDAAWFRLRNAGAGFRVGIGQDYTIRNSISEPGVSGGEGTAMVAGIPGQVTVANPEPATWATLAGALAVFGAVVLRRRANRSRT